MPFREEAGVDAAREREVGIGEDALLEARLVLMPSIRVAASAPRSRSSAVARSGPWAITLAIIEL